MLIIFAFSADFAGWVIICDFFIDFDNLVAVFVCSIVTSSTSAILDFPEDFCSLIDFLSLLF